MVPTPSSLSRFLLACFALISLLPEGVRADEEFRMLRSFPWSMIPSSDLIQGDDGFFYGLTGGGGLYEGGMLYRLGADGSLQILHNFVAVHDIPNEKNAEGSFPEGMEKGEDGTLFGGTRYGGAFGLGTLFSYQPSTGLFTTIHHFYRSTDRYHFSCGPDGAIYGTSAASVYRVSRDGTFTILHQFTPNVQTADHEEPYDPSSILVGKDGAIYGTTARGGPGVGGSYGVAFRLDPDGTFTVLHEFQGPGETPKLLCQAGDGSFYGAAGTAPYNAMVFKMSPAGEVTPLKVFTSWQEGSGIMNLVIARDGTLYGTTAYGGVSINNGNVFRISAEGEYARIYNYPFNNGHTGVIVGSDGALYGTVAGSDADEAPEGTVAKRDTWEDSVAQTDRTRIAVRSQVPKKRSGAFRIGTRPGEARNRSPIVRNEWTTMRRAGTRRIAILRNDKDPDKGPLQVKALTGAPEGISAIFDPATKRLVLSTSTVPLQTAAIRYTVTDGTNDSLGTLVLRPAFAGTYQWQNDADVRLQLTLTPKGVVIGTLETDGKTHRLRASVALDDTILGAINASSLAVVVANLKVTGTPYHIAGTITVDGTVYDVDALQR
jgi:uncharacterized repeat protein (TIGR03803 family)